MADNSILEPVKLYNQQFKDKFNENCEKYFDELVEKSGINIEENRQNAQRISNAVDEVTNTAGKAGRALNNASKAAMARTARNAAKRKGKSFIARNIFKGASFLSKIGIISSIIGVIVFILMIIGALSFFMNMPGMVIDGIKEWADDAWSTVMGYVVGKDYVSQKQVDNLATQMYNLRSRFGILGTCIYI